MIEEELAQILCDFDDRAVTIEEATKRILALLPKLTVEDIESLEWIQKQYILCGFAECEACNIRLAEIRDTLNKILEGKR